MPIPILTPWESGMDPLHLFRPMDSDTVEDPLDFFRSMALGALTAVETHRFKCSRSECQSITLWVNCVRASLYSDAHDGIAILGRVLKSRAFHVAIAQMNFCSFD